MSSSATSSQLSSQGESRPNMRRKSSASNLLMRAGQGGMLPPVSVGGPPPIAIPASILYSSKDSDAQSTFSDGSTAVNPGQTNLDYLQTEIVKKRLTALTYLRNVHEGKAHWIGTIYLSRQDLDRAFSNTAMRKRTTRFAVLAMSLSSPIESTTLVDMLRTVVSILAEYDQFQDENYKPRTGMRIPGFRSSRLNRADLAPTDAYLTVPNIPFPLDYRQVLLSFIDVLSELYHRLGALLAQLQQQSQSSGPGNPMSPPATWTLPGPPLVPQHGVEYVADEELLKLAESAHGTARLMEVGSPTGFSAGAWSSTVGELVLKVDGKFKKILATLFKELDDLARQGIRDELASLDPLLRNVAPLPTQGVAIAAANGPPGEDYDPYDNL